jgi:hypothetical protein
MKAKPAQLYLELRLSLAIYSIWAVQTNKGLFLKSCKGDVLMG